MLQKGGRQRRQGEGSTYTAISKILSPYYEKFIHTFQIRKQAKCKKKENLRNKNKIRQFISKNTIYPILGREGKAREKPAKQSQKY